MSEQQQKTQERILTGKVTKLSNEEREKLRQ